MKVAKSSLLSSSYGIPTLAPVHTVPGTGRRKPPERSDVQEVGGIMLRRQQRVYKNVFSTSLFLSMLGATNSPM